MMLFQIKWSLNLFSKQHPDLKTIKIWLQEFIDIAYNAAAESIT
jgi:hypothetical protein